MSWLADFKKRVIDCWIGVWTLDRFEISEGLG